MADLGDLSGEKRDELLRSFRFAEHIREMFEASPMRHLQASITADMRAQRELLSAFTMPKFEALRMPLVLDNFRNLGTEMAAASERIRQMHASSVGRELDAFRQSFSIVEKMKAETAALHIPPVIDSLRLASLIPPPPLPSIAQSFATLTDFDWRDEDEVLRERVTQLEEQVRELQAQLNPPEQPQPPEPLDDPTLHTGQYL